MKLPLEVERDERVALEGHGDGVARVGMYDGLRPGKRICRRVQNGVARRRRAFGVAIWVDVGNVFRLQVAAHRIRARDPHAVAVAHAHVAAVARDQAHAVEVAADLLEVTQRLGRNGHRGGLSQGDAGHRSDHDNSSFEGRGPRAEGRAARPEHGSNYVHRNLCGCESTS